METEMIYWGIAGYIIVLSVPVFLVSIWLLRRGLIYFKKHDLEKAIFKDKWSTLNIAVYMIAILVCALAIYWFWAFGRVHF